MDLGAWNFEPGETTPIALRASKHKVQRSKLSARAFTLTEILIVIALIILVIALAIPAFSFITGSRSVDAGENLVSAMLSRARADAINNTQTVGVAFFRDTKTDRSAMALVVQASQRNATATEPPGLEQYKAWKQFQENGTTPTRYEPGDVVCCLVQVQGTSKMGTQLFVCKAVTGGPGHNSSAGTKPPNATYWGRLDEAEFDTLVGVEYQYLPAGVGAQTINDPNPTGALTEPRDRYLRNGLILFGPDGQLVHRQYAIYRPPFTDTDETHLYLLMNFHQRPNPLDTQPVGTDPQYPVFSQFGVVLYDEELFRSAGGSHGDPTLDNVDYDNDSQPNTEPEEIEENWLDNNSLSLMVNRYNGTLVRGE